MAGFCLPPYLQYCLATALSQLQPPSVPFLHRVLLLDEITVDLDVLGRSDLMRFLQKECSTRGATVIYVRPCLIATSDSSSCKAFMVP